MCHGLCFTDSTSSCVELQQALFFQLHSFEHVQKLTVPAFHRLRELAFLTNCLHYRPHEAPAWYLLPRIYNKNNVCGSGPRGTFSHHSQCRSHCPHCKVLLYFVFFIMCSKNKTPKHLASSNINHSTCRTSQISTPWAPLLRYLSLFHCSCKVTRFDTANS